MRPVTTVNEPRSQRQVDILDAIFRAREVIAQVGGFQAAAR